MHMVVVIMINLHAKFVMSIFIGSKDMSGARKFRSGSHTIDHAYLGDS